MSKKIKVIFTLSIILNVLFIGLMVGHFQKMKKHADWHQVKETLAPETRGILKDTFKGRWKNMRTAFKEMRDNKMAMKEVLIAEDFDALAYDKVAEKMVEFNGIFMRDRIDAIKEVFAKLPQEERVKLADHTIEKLTGRGHPRHKKPPHDKDKAERWEKSKHDDVEDRPQEPDAVDAPPE
ncbi:MAG: periplasmic heavy metal sensor [Alcanivorax sp.]